MPRRSASSAAFPLASASRLKPPEDLGPLERAEFLNLVLASRADHFNAADLPAISAYCRAIVAERRAAGELDAAPVTEDGKPSPWLPVWQAQLRALTTLARRLQIGPAGSKPKYGEPKEAAPVSYYEMMELEGRRDEPPEPS
jgi:phage terminase small subunit